MCNEEIVASLLVVIIGCACFVTMDSEKHKEFLNYFLNKVKKYSERMYNLSPKKREIRRRILGDL